ncbi:MAG: hypothetical protein HY926_12335 [Elusimicrobia bacterium]|nr:hypothetical protein [Elusimicrobiota bacterium]
MKLPPARSLIATLVAVLLGAPLLLMYARWGSIWLWPGLVLLAIAAAWRRLWYPRSGYTVLIGCGAGALAGILLGALLTIPAASALKGVKIRPSLLRTVLMFHGSWIGLLVGLFVGYYRHLKKVMGGPTPAIPLPSPAVPPPGQVR